jgi:phosphoglycerate dehydrogenase-like enzyme
MPKLLILAGNAGEYESLLRTESLPQLEGIIAAADPAAALAGGADCEIVLGEPARIREVLAGLPRLRWVQSIWAGVEPLLDPSLRRDYSLTNARGVFGTLMSEYIFGYLLAHERRIFERMQAQQAGRWEAIRTGTLRGKTIGLLGVGSIGSVLARTAKHFDMNVRGYTLTSEHCPDVDAYFHGGQLEEFAAGLDYLVCVLPNTTKTRRLVDAALLARLPAHALFFNVGRGATVDEAALLAVLKGGRLAGAVLDVFEQEPLPPGHPFWQTPNLWMTFHTSAPSIPADLVRLFVDNYRRYLSGQALLYQVDFERGY